MSSTLDTPTWDRAAQAPPRPADISSGVGPPAAAAGLRPWPRALAAVAALLSLAAGGWLALHYPVAAPAAPVAFVVLAALAALWPNGWLLLLFALLPILGFAPYTGWITFEETDLLVLAAAAGGYARLAQRPAAAAAARRQRGGGQGASAPIRLLLLLFGASVLIALARGLADAGGFRFGWFQGYLEPMNSVRLGKSFFLALLLLPLWQARERAAPGRAERWLVAGLTAGLALAALTTVWERLAFTGLLNFSSDYRTTGLFWEMHVGGAALDGFLALTLPFALAALLAARSLPGFALAALALGVAGYSGITTFSRGVYLALPIGAALTLALHWRAQRRQRTPGVVRPQTGGRLWAALLVAGGFSAAVWWIFPGSGYRGVLGVLGTMAAWLAIAPSLRSLKGGQWLAAFGLGALLSSLLLPLAWLLPMGAYLAFGLSVAAVLALALAQGTGARALLSPLAPRIAVLGLAGLVAVATGLALVAAHRGGQPALHDAAFVLGGLLLLTIGCGAFDPLAVPFSPRWRAATFGAALLAALVVAAIGGGGYMSGRFATGGKDLDDRFSHWREGLALLSGSGDWTLGKGLGRFAASNYFAGATAGHPGDYRLATEDGHALLRLSAGRHMLGWGELLRVSQRVTPPLPPVEVRARVRTRQDAELHFEVCAKQLLYDHDCLIANVPVRAGSGEWQELVARLGNGTAPTRGAWWAPAPIMFSMAVGNPQALVEFDRVALLDGMRADLLENGDFSHGMAHWFFSSDRMHLPWHIKNMFLHVLFDQGALGLALLALLLLVAFWRLGPGQGRDHPLAPAVAGALAGFLVVGLFDSLLDVPRDALVFYFLLLLALTLRRPAGGS